MMKMILPLPPKIHLLNNVSGGFIAVTDNADALFNEILFAHKKILRY